MDNKDKAVKKYRICVDEKIRHNSALDEILNMRFDSKNAAIRKADELWAHHPTTYYIIPEYSSN